MEKWISIIIIGLFGSFLFASIGNAKNDTSSRILVSDANQPSPLVRQLMEKKKWTEVVGILRPIVKNGQPSLQVITDLSVALTYSGNRAEALGILHQSIQKMEGQNSKKNEKNYLIRRIRVLSRLFLTHRTFQTYQDGINLLTEKKYRMANEKFQKALLDEPENVEILTRSGQSFFLENDFEKAVQKLRLAIQANPYQPEVNLWLGRALFQQSHFTEAINELNYSYNELRNFELASLWLSDALFGGGQVSSAIHVLEADVKRWPLHVLSLMNLAKFRLQFMQADSHSLWAARKDLQLAMSRIVEYSQARSKDTEFFEESNHLGVDLEKTPEVIKSEIFRLQQQVDARLKQVSEHHHS